MYQAIIIDFQPIPQKRHRTSTRGGFTRNYDPSAKDKKKFAALVRECAGSGWPSDKPLSVTLNFIIQRPKSHCRVNGELRKSVQIRHTSKPDLDNLVKFVLDACNGILWVDDSQIWEMTARKEYTDLSENPKPHIRIDIEETKQ